MRQDCGEGDLREGTRIPRVTQKAVLTLERCGTGGGGGGAPESRPRVSGVERGKYPPPTKKQKKTPHPPNKPPTTDLGKADKLGGETSQAMSRKEREGKHVSGEKGGGEVRGSELPTRRSTGNVTS